MPLWAGVVEVGVITRLLGVEVVVYGDVEHVPSKVGHPFVILHDVSRCRGFQPSALHLRYGGVYPHVPRFLEHTRRDAALTLAVPVEVLRIVEQGADDDVLYLLPSIHRCHFLKLSELISIVLHR